MTDPESAETQKQRDITEARAVAAARRARDRTLTPAERLQRLDVHCA
ncbi:MAG TPA: hypothetical protein VF533_04900 [Solirubrobacteraceae bacterium]|jgi:hypothetical protein